MAGALLLAVCTVLGPSILVLASFNITGTGSDVYRGLQLLAMLLSIVSFLQLRDFTSISRENSIRLTELVFQPDVSENSTRELVCKSDMLPGEVCMEVTLEATAMVSCLLMLATTVIRCFRRRKNKDTRQGHSEILRDIFIMAVLLQYVVFLIYNLGCGSGGEHDGAAFSITAMSDYKVYSGETVWERVGPLISLLGMACVAAICATLPWTSMTKELEERVARSLDGIERNDPMEEKLKWENCPNYATFMAV